MTLPRVDPQLTEFDTFAARQRSLDSGHKHLCFGGQVRGDLVEGPGFVPLQELLDGPFTGIVSRQGQPPVFKVGVKVVEVFGRGAGAVIGA